ncbi:MAG: hypothetical protein WAU91_05540 [Desulfatitalea sp.]
MDNVFLVAGIACLIASIVGGGLKAFGIEIPILKSSARQFALGVLGVILILVGTFIYSETGPNIKPKPTPTPTPHNQTIRPTPVGGPISVSVNNNPRVVSPGGRTEISVMATASDGSVIPGAAVVVSAGGGVFEETGALKSIGATNDKGVYRTVWRTYEPHAYSGDMSYLIDVEVSKEGFIKGQGTTEVFVRK